MTTPWPLLSSTSVSISVVSSEGRPVTGSTAPVETFGKIRISTRPSRVMRGVTRRTTPTSRNWTLSMVLVCVVVVMR